jgi:hypothetical protein
LNADPEFQRNRRAAIVHGFQANPERRAEYAKRARIAGQSARSREANSQRLRERPIWQLGHAALPPGCDARKRGGAARSARHLAWCPPELRDEYRRLVANKKVPAKEARAVILDQHEAELRRFRRSIGIVEAEQFGPIEPIDATLDFLSRASIVAARSVGIPELWVPLRTPPVVRARWAVLVALQSGGWDVPRIAAAVGMDRKTVTYGLRQAEALTADAEFNALLRKVAAA